MKRLISLGSVALLVAACGDSPTQPLVEPDLLPTTSAALAEAPSIDIRKQADGADSRTFPSGSDVTFQIAVENTGNVPLAGVVVTDALTPDCNLDVSSVVFGGGPLPPGVTVFYACTASSVTAGFTNVACVEGVSPGTTTVSDCDPSTVVIEEVDSDGDGVPDPDDAFPNSDTRPTIVIDGRDTGVGNQQLDEPPGAFFADVIGQCAADAFTHTDFVDCVAHGVTSWRKAGLISGRDQGRIMRAAGMADIP
jgi:uncharacterized repeat protein (TIGR01451 family)